MKEGFEVSSFNQSYLGEKQVIVQAKSFQGNIRKNIYVTEQIITLLLDSIKGVALLQHGKSFSVLSDHFMHGHERRCKPLISFLKVRNMTK